MSEAHAMIGGESCRAGRRASSNSQNSTEEQTVTVVPEDSEIRVASETLSATSTRMSSGSASAASASSSSSPANIMTQFREGKSRSARVLVDAKNLILGNTDSAAAQLRRENEIKERRRQLWAEYAKFSSNGKMTRPELEKLLRKRAYDNRRSEFLERRGMTDMVFDYNPGLMQRDRQLAVDVKKPPSHHRSCKAAINLALGSEEGRTMSFEEFVEFNSAGHMSVLMTGVTDKSRPRLTRSSMSMRQKGAGGRRRSSDGGGAEFTPTDEMKRIGGQGALAEGNAMSPLKRGGDEAGAAERTSLVRSNSLTSVSSESSSGHSNVTRGMSFRAKKASGLFVPPTAAQMAAQNSMKMRKERRERTKSASPSPSDDQSNLLIAPVPHGNLISSPFPPMPRIDGSPESAKTSPEMSPGAPTRLGLFFGWAGFGKTDSLSSSKKQSQGDRRRPASTSPGEGRRLSSFFNSFNGMFSSSKTSLGSMGELAGEHDQDTDWQPSQIDQKSHGTPGGKFGDGDSFNSTLHTLSTITDELAPSQTRRASLPFPPIQRKKSLREIAETPTRKNGRRKSMA